eukprot:5010472-Amphidinium_carterae.1
MDESSVGKAKDHSPSGPKLEAMRELWGKVGLSRIPTSSSSGLAAGVPNGNLSVILCGDLYQLPPVRGHPIFKAPMHWLLFTMIELEANKRASKDAAFQGFADMLSRLRVGELTEQDKVVLRSRVSEPTAEEARDAVSLFPRRDQVSKANTKRMEAMTCKKEESIALDTYDQPRVGDLLPSSDLPEDDRHAAGMPLSLSMTILSSILMYTHTHFVGTAPGN